MLSSKFVLLLALVCGPALAQTTAMELRHANGDVLSIQKLENGEVWASFFLSDQMTASFANNELIVLQVDQQKPVKLEQGFRSCGAPAPEAQQVVYAFEQAEDAVWSFSGYSKPKQDVLKMLGWDSEEFNKVIADRRLEVVDFPLSRNDVLSQQMVNGAQLSFRYMTNQGEQRQTVFYLTPHQHILEQLIPH